MYKFWHFFFSFLRYVRREIFFLAFDESSRFDASGSRMCRVLPSYFNHTRYSTRAAYFIVVVDQRTKPRTQPFVHAASSGGSANVRSACDLIYDAIRNDSRRDSPRVSLCNYSAGDYDALLIPSTNFHFEHPAKSERIKINR